MASSTLHQRSVPVGSRKTAKTKWTTFVEVGEGGWPFSTSVLALYVCHRGMFLLFPKGSGQGLCSHRGRSVDSTSLVSLTYSECLSAGY